MPKKTRNTYIYPVDQSQVRYAVQQTYSNSHSGPYKGSVDFNVPPGTAVMAAGDGVVWRVRDDSDQYGQDKKFGQAVNYISILHDEDEISEYLHLGKGSARVKPGQHVKAGEIIAETGLSGWMHAPHLHFMVYKKAAGKDFQCLSIKFAILGA